MARIITNVAFDLTFNMDDAPPKASIAFTDQDEAGRETHGSVVLADDEAKGLFTSDHLAILKRAIEKKEKDLREPGSWAARIEAASKAEERKRNADSAAAKLDEEIASKRAEAEALSAQLLEKQVAVENATAELAEKRAGMDAPRD